MATNQRNSTTLKHQRRPLDQSQDRDSTDAQKITSNSKNQRFLAARSRQTILIGWWLDLQVHAQPAVANHLAQLDDIYRQHFCWLDPTMALGEGNLKSEVRVSFRKIRAQP